uniref:OTU domain-containing protein n=1 Tax=Panagrellus redivivus TaxID=6233 RepID=A0A7E4WDX1_PANRE
MSSVNKFSRSVPQLAPVLTEVVKKKEVRRKPQNTFSKSMKPAAPPSSSSQPVKNVYLHFHYTAHLKFPFDPPTAEQLKLNCVDMKVPFLERLQFSPPPAMQLSTWTTVTTTPVMGDGSCGYRALSVLLTGRQEYHQQIRWIINDRIQSGAMPQKFYDFAGMQVIQKAQDKKTAANAAHPYYWFNVDDAYAFSLICDVNVFIYNAARMEWTLYNRTLFSQKKDEETTLVAGSMFHLLLKSDHFEPILSLQ